MLTRRGTSRFVRRAALSKRQNIFTSEAQTFSETVAISRSCRFAAPAKHENEIESAYDRMVCIGTRPILLGAE